MKADYPLRFINSVANEFQKGKECGDESFIVPTNLFEIARPLIFVEISYCELNKIKLKHFLKKFHKFTNNSFKMVITRKTRNIRSLFPLKDKKITNRVLSVVDNRATQDTILSHKQINVCHFHIPFF